MGMSLEASILSLRMWYGDDHHPTLVGSTITIHLGMGDPRDGGVELDTTDYPGYAALSLANDSTNFPDPDTEGDLTPPVVTVCTATGDWADVPDYAWTQTGTTVIDVVALDTSDGDMPAAGGVVEVDLTMFYDENTR